MNAGDQSLALIVRQAPYHQRYARAQLDVALAAATLEIHLKIFFIGDGLWQLSKQRSVTAARLPRGLKGWAALSGMTRVEFFGESQKLNTLTGQGVEWVVAVQGLDLDGMPDEWAGCSQVMSL